MFTNCIHLLWDWVSCSKVSIISGCLSTLVKPISFKRFLSTISKVHLEISASSTLPSSAFITPDEGMRQECRCSFVRTVGRRSRSTAPRCCLLSRLIGRTGWTVKGFPPRLLATPNAQTVVQSRLQEGTAMPSRDGWSREFRGHPCRTVEDPNPGPEVSK